MRTLLLLLCLSIGVNGQGFIGARPRKPLNSTSGTGLTNSLIAEWKLNEASGSATDSEPTGTAQTLTASGSPVSATGKLNNARQFVKASSQTLAASDSADLSTGNIDFSISCWVYMDTKPAIIMGIATKGNQTGAASGYEWALYWDNSTDRFSFSVSDGATQHTVRADGLGAPSTATWYYIAAWHDAAGDTINIQCGTAATLSGSPNSTVHSTGSFDSATPLTVGEVFGSSRFWDGRIDEIKFWKRALSGSDVTSDWNGGAGIELY